MYIWLDRFTPTPRGKTQIKEFEFPTVVGNSMTGDQEIPADHCKELSRWAAMRELTPAQQPEQRSPKSRNCRYPCKEQRQANEALWSWESEDIAGIPMVLLRKEQSLVLWCLSASLLLSSCGGAGPECGSLDSRNSVVKIVSDDTNNKLVNYAVKNSSSVAAMVGDTKSEAEKLGIWEKAKQGAVYRLDDTILTNSRNRAAHEVTCIGLLYVTVADATAQKEIEFKVKQAADGKIIVSVNPFLF